VFRYHCRVAGARLTPNTATTSLPPATLQWLRKTSATTSTTYSPPRNWSSPRSWAPHRCCSASSRWASRRPAASWTCWRAARSSALLRVPRLVTYWSLRTNWRPPWLFFAAEVPIPLGNPHFPTTLRTIHGGPRRAVLTACLHRHCHGPARRSRWLRVLLLLALRSRAQGARGSLSQGAGAASAVRGGCRVDSRRHSGPHRHPRHRDDLRRRGAHARRASRRGDRQVAH